MREIPLPPRKCSRAERWVWNEVHQSHAADLNTMPHERGRVEKLLPEELEARPERRLTSRFLKALLQAKSLPPGGVYIAGAWFEESIILSRLNLETSLYLMGCNFSKNVDMEFIVLKGHLWLENTKINGCVDLRRARIGGDIELRTSSANHVTLRQANAEASVFIRGGASFGSVDLSDLTVAGQLGVEDTIVGDPSVATESDCYLDMRGVSVGRSLVLRRGTHWYARFQQINLSDARIAQHLAIHGIITYSSLNIQTAVIGGDLRLTSCCQVPSIQACGARVSGQVQIRDCVTTNEVDFDGIYANSMRFKTSRFHAVNLTDAQVDASVDLVDVGVTTSLTGVRAKIGGHLSAKHIRVGNAVNLNSIEIGGSADFTGTKGQSGQEKLPLFDARFSAIGGEIVLDRSAVEAIELGSTQGGGSLHLSAADIGSLSLNSASLDGHVYGNGKFNAIDLQGLRVQMGLSFRHAHVYQEVKLGNANVGIGIDFGEGQFNSIDCRYCRIGANIDFQHATIWRADLSGATVQGELRLAGASGFVRWVCNRAKQRPHLSLQNVTAGTLLDDEAAEQAWPNSVDLSGFLYQGFGSTRSDKHLSQDSGSDKEIALRRKRWLCKQAPFTPQPYERCAKVLEEMGHPAAASDVLFERRERERRNAWNDGDRLRALGLALRRWLIGYGYGRRLLWRPLGWASLLIVSGVAVLCVAGEAIELPNVVQWHSATAMEWMSNVMHLSFFSLDLLLPVIELNREHAETITKLSSVVQFYFFMQQLTGWVLVLFIVAGLGGLAK